MVGGGGVEVWFPLRPHATDLLVSGTCRGGRVGRKNAVRGGSFKKKKKSCTEKMGKGEMREENRSRGGRGARGRICGRGGAGAAPPDLDQSPLLRFQAP